MDSVALVSAYRLIDAKFSPAPDPWKIRRSFAVLSMAWVPPAA
jgi:hypothetical protein